jgi:Na+-transporting NADH:ubiquinone oxidoreductase subunit C
MERSTGYIIGFAAAVCLVCSVLVTSSAVSLKDRQMENKRLDRQKKILVLAGLMEKGEDIDSAEIDKRFGDNIKAYVIDMETGDYDASADAANFDQRKAAKEPATSETAPDNKSGIQRVPNQALIYHVLENGEPVTLILPVEGKGLWSTMYGFLALATDTTTVKGITFYEHGETPGLGGEIENPSWTAKWPGRQAYDESWNPVLKVIKGAAGPVETDPTRIDGLAGATLTARGVSHLLDFWLGKNGFSPYLEKFRAERSAS